MPKINEELKLHFCIDNYKKCARYLVFRKVGLSKIPVNLAPDHFNPIKIKQEIEKVG